MKYRVKHVTEYSYGKPVTLCYNLAYLLLRSTPYQTCLSSSIDVSPAVTVGHRRTDYFGNTVYYFTLEQPHDYLKVEVVSDVNVKDVKTAQERDLNLDFGLTCDETLQALRSRTDHETLKSREFVLKSPMVKLVPGLRDYAAPLFEGNRPFLSAVRELNQRIYEDFTYDPSSTGVATPLAEVLEHRSGVCQDFAHLAIGCLRSLGFAARYVSGYLETLPPPGQEKLVGSDASHAWFAVYSPGEGWFEFDPTNNNMPAEQHITTAWGRDYSDVSPLRGVFFDGGDTQELKVAVDVIRL